MYFDLNKFGNNYSYYEQLMHLEKHLKISLCMVFKKNRFNHFFFDTSTSEAYKTALRNLDIHEFSYSERLIHLKRNLKSLCIEFSLGESLPKPKTGIRNLGFNKFFCGNRLIHSKKHVTRCLFIKFEENR